MTDRIDERSDNLHAVIWRSLGDSFPAGSEEHWRGQPYAIDVPNAALREASSVADAGSFYMIGEAWAQIAMRLSPTDAPVVLDIGCGCGKMARFFVMNPQARYIGIDVFRPAVEWCKVAFGPLTRFQFKHLDVRSEVYNASGSMEADAAVLPANDAGADVIICGSLFTHLLEPAFRRYMTEVKRCLSARGRAIVSIHNEPSDGRFSGDEARIDISDALFVQIVEESGMRVLQHVGNVYGQQVYALTRDH